MVHFHPIYALCLVGTQQLSRAFAANILQRLLFWKTRRCYVRSFIAHIGSVKITPLGEGSQFTRSILNSSLFKYGKTPINYPSTGYS